MSNDTKLSRTEALDWIADVFEEAAGSLGENTPRDAIPGWDSLGVLTLMAGLDERFDIRLTDDQLGSLLSVKDIMNVLNEGGHLSD